MPRFIDFYGKNKYIPTHQEGIDYDKFCKRRALLYKDLSLPLHLLSGKTVIEFGPGGGYNARPILDTSPNRYDFVDAMDAHIAVLDKNIANGRALGVKIEIFESLFSTFEIERKYDLVIAEACIPGQDNPLEVLENISNCVGENGFLVITNTSKTSMLSEILRSVIGKWMSKQVSDEIEFIERCVVVFQGHLDILKTETRTTRDWVLDNIVHEWHVGKSDFSLPEAFQLLQELEFTYHGGSPSFYRDFLWYKNESKGSTREESEVVKQYKDIELIFLDYRVSIEEFLEHSNSYSREEILIQISDVFDSAKMFLKSGDESQLLILLSKTRDLALHLSTNFKRTSRSLLEFSSFPEKLENPSNESFKEFQGWWGHGQQYNSFQKL